MIAALISPADHVGWAWRTSAAMPAVAGAAIDVPLADTPSFPVPDAAEKIVAPGAETSGLTLPAIAVPREVNDASVSVGSVGPGGTMRRIVLRRSALSVAVTAVPASRASRRALVPVALVSTTGMSGLPAMPTPKRTSAEPRMAPVAPAATALAERAPDPQRRWTSSSSHRSSATLPATLAASAALKGLQPSVLLVSLGGSSHVPTFTTVALVTPDVQAYSIERRAGYSTAVAEPMRAVKPSTI